jgi:hypothetical protein
VACYDGPAGTEGVGSCKAGSKTCAFDGASFGPCAGAILPVVENCATPVDEDCDGLAPPCKGVFSWAKSFGDANNQQGTGVAVDSAGDVVVIGTFSGSIDFGDGPLTSAGGDDIFVAKLDASGNHVWSKRFGDANNQQGTGVAVDSAGDVVVIGTFSGSIDFGDGPLTSAGGDDIFVAKLDASGNHVWSKRFGDASNQAPNGVAVDSADSVLVTGYFFGSVDFGGDMFTSAGAGDIFVAKLGASGNHLWSKSFGDVSNQAAQGVAVDDAGDVIVTGYIYGAVDFGGGPRVANGRDVFVAKLDSSGNHLWSKNFGDEEGQTGAGVAVDSMGNVLVTGYFYGAVNFGGGTLKSVGINDVFVAKLGASGNHVWSKRFGDEVDQQAAGVAVDSADNVLVAGYFSGAVNFGDSQLVCAGSSDIFVAKLDASGNPQWSKSFGDAEDQIGASVAVDSAGNAIITGYFSGSVDFGGGPLVCAGVRDVFVAKFGL